PPLCAPGSLVTKHHQQTIFWTSFHGWQPQDIYLIIFILSATSLPSDAFISTSAAHFSIAIHPPATNHHTDLSPRITTHSPWHSSSTPTMTLVTCFQKTFRIKTLSFIIIVF
ncbi:hypothetical protein ILYODFUR_012242, partial [Ilyodon furcidens]